MVLFVSIDSTFPSLAGRRETALLSSAGSLSLRISAPGARSDYFPTAVTKSLKINATAIFLPVAIAGRLLACWAAILFWFTCLDLRLVCGYGAIAGFFVMGIRVLPLLHFSFLSNTAELFCRFCHHLRRQGVAQF